MNFTFPYDRFAELSGDDVLLALGWRPELLNERGGLAADERFGTLVPARVAAVHRGGVDLLCASGFHSAELLLAAGHAAVHAAVHAAAGAEAAADGADAADVQLRDQVAAGDWVLAGDSLGRLFVRHILPRQSELRRKQPGVSSDSQLLAANLNAVWIVQGLDRDFNPRRLERTLALVYAAELPATVILTKADEHPDAEEQLTEAMLAAPGCRVRAVSGVSGQGIEELRELLRPRELVALIGSSGAGKSTLLNALCGRIVQETGAVRATDGRGKHTTTVRRIVPLPNGALVLDTPGMRELGLFGAGDAVSAAFPELEELAGQCRFRDCQHEEEPGCAVRAAIASGRIPADRLESLRKLEREDLHARARTDERARRERKVAEKKLHSQYREIQQRNRRARGRE